MPWTVAVVETAQEEDNLVAVLEATDGERMSSAERRDVVSVLKEWIAREEAKERR